MELIPIIYTALIIFLIITVVTIISSYVSYKVRRKSNNEDEKDKQKFYDLHENAVQPKKNIVIKKQEHPKVEKKHPQKDHDISKKNIKKQSSLTTPPSSKSELSKRINILNPAVKQQSSEKPPVEKEKENKSLHTLDDNIFDKYSDGNDDDLHSLNATREE